MMVGKHGIQTFEVVLVMLMLFQLLLDVFVPISAHSLFSLLLGKWFVQILLNVNHLLIVSHELHVSYHNLVHLGYGKLGPLHTQD